MTSNGGVTCDVTDGPCACGAWHTRHTRLVRTTVSPGVDLVVTATARRGDSGAVEISKAYHFDNGNALQEPIDESSYYALALVDQSMLLGCEPPAIRKALDGWADELQRDAAPAPVEGP